MREALEFAVLVLSGATAITALLLLLVLFRILVSLRAYLIEFFAVMPLMPSVPLAGAQPATTPGAPDPANPDAVRSWLQGLGLTFGLGEVDPEAARRPGNGEINPPLNDWDTEQFERSTTGSHGA